MKTMITMRGKYEGVVIHVQPWEIASLEFHPAHTRTNPRQKVSRAAYTLIHLGSGVTLETPETPEEINAKLEQFYLEEGPEDE